MVNTVVAMPQIVTLGFELNGNLREFRGHRAKFRVQEANFGVDRGERLEGFRGVKLLELMRGSWSNKKLQAEKCQSGFTKFLNAFELLKKYRPKLADNKIHRRAKQNQRSRRDT